jgi:hypothetical protein
LSQVRLDLKAAIEGLGLEPIISENFAFPVDPNIDVITNCLKVVKDRADIFVLILGGRYGSETESGRSITNLEYLEAKAKGVPVYVFVTKSVLDVLPVWKKNLTGDFSDVVDTTKVFAFVEEVRTAKDHWLFSFDNAGQIIETLRKQLAYLFMDALLIRERVRDLNLPPSLSQLSGPSLRLLMERSTAWEHFFFASLLEDELAKNSELKWDLKYAIKTGSIRKFISGDLRNDALQFSEWIQQKIADIRALVDSVESLMNVAIQDALREPGTPGDPEHLAYVARRIASLHARLLTWAINFNETEVRPQFRRVLEIIANFADDSIHQLETIPDRLRSEISKAIAAMARGETYVADVMLVFSNPSDGKLPEEFEKLTAWVIQHADDPPPDEQFLRGLHQRVGAEKGVSL